MGHVSQQHVFLIELGLIGIATFRSPDLPDYGAYLDFKLASLDEEYYARFEPATFIIRSFSDWLSDSYYLFFLIYALISVVIKICAIQKLTTLFYLSLLSYLSFDFPIHEMIQMRAAVSMGIMLWALLFVYDKRIWPFIGLVLLAISFHYSAILVLPLYFLNPHEINTKKQISFLLGAFVLGVMKVGLGYWIQFIPIAFIQNLYQIYHSHEMIEENGTSIFSFTILMLTILQFILLFNVNKLQEHNKYIYLLLKIQTISLCSFFIFNDMPMIGGRISEFYRIPFIISIPLISFLLKNRTKGKVIVVAVCLVFFIRFFTLYYL